MSRLCKVVLLGTVCALTVLLVQAAVVCAGSREAVVMALAAPDPADSVATPTGAYSPTAATIGSVVTFSGRALPNTFMSAYFYCENNCGETKVGVANVNSSGNYSLSFVVPPVAKPGKAYLKAGCDTCGNNWWAFAGLTITQPVSSPRPAPATAPTGAFDTSNVVIGGTVTLSGAAKPGSYMSAYFYCENNCGETRLGAANVNAGGYYALTFKVPGSAKRGSAYVRAGCDGCGNSWQKFSGLTLSLPSAMRGVVFINYDFPLQLGHVGWGFELSPGTFVYGAKEATGTVLAVPGQANAVFVAVGTEREMLQNMKTGNHCGSLGCGSRFPYHAYKYVTIQNPNPDAAQNLAYESKGWGYALSGNNCMDDVFKIIKAYANGDDKILPWPSTHWAPKVFFKDIGTQAYGLK